MIPRQTTRLSNTFWHSLLLSTVLPVVLLTLVFAMYGSRLAEKRLLDRLEVASSLTSELVDNFVQLHLAALQSEAAKARDQPIDSAGLDRLRRLYPAFLTTLRTDAQGLVVAVSPAERLQPGVKLDVSDREYFSVPLATGQPVVTNGFIGRGLGHDKLVAVSAPVWSGEQFDGVVEGSLPVAAFTQVAERGLAGLGLEMLVVGSDGRVIHSTEGAAARFGDSVEVLLGFDWQLWLQAGGTPLPVAGLLVGEGDSRLVGRRLASGWSLLLLAPERLLAEQRALLFAYALLVLLAVIAGGAWVQRWQARRLASGVARFSDDLLGLSRPDALREATLRELPEELAPAGRAVVDLSNRLDRSFSELRAALDQQLALSCSLEKVLAERDAEIRSQTEALRQANAQLEALANTDPLCGVLNRRGLEAACQPWVDAEGCLLTPLALLTVDIDHFKVYNDANGHPAGDSVLKRVAGALRAAMRGPTDQIARVGGEEFVVLLPEASLDVARSVAGRILESVRELRIPHPARDVGEVSVSIGVSLSKAGEAWTTLCSESDSALYRAKSGGRNRFEHSAASGSPS